MKHHKVEILSIPPEELQRLFETPHIPQFTVDGACVNCNDRPVIRLIQLSKVHLYGLWKLAQGINRKGKNQIHLIDDLQDDLKLTNYEYVCFQQLRYFGLARPCEDANGSWLITHLGNEFLHNRLPAREWVRIIKNKLLEADLGRSMKKVYFNDIKDFPAMATPAFEIIAGDVVYFPTIDRQAKLFDLKPQTA